MKRLGLIGLALLTLACGSGTIPPLDCRTWGCPTGFECEQHPGHAPYTFYCKPLPQPSPSPTPAPSPSPSATPTPQPSATPTPQPTPTPAPTPSPCIPQPAVCSTKTERVCVSALGVITAFDPAQCWTCPDWLGYMMRDREGPGSASFTPGDPKEDGDASGTHPGRWINYDANGNFAGSVDKKNCTNANGGLVVDWPRAEVKEHTVCAPAVPCPGPTPSPGATPTPGPGGCPGLLAVGNSYLSSVPCGKQCLDQGYLGYRLNLTGTPLCREGDPGCVCDPTRNRCEMPKQCQDPRGADIFLTLAGHFADDECDRNSDNFYNCHHKPKLAETGVTLVISTPWQEPKNPWDPRAIVNCIDVTPSGGKPLERKDARCQAALKAAGR